MVFVIVSFTLLVLLFVGAYAVVVFVNAWNEVTISLNCKRDTSKDGLVSKVANTTEVLMRDREQLNTLQRIRLCIAYNGMLKHAMSANRLLHRYNKTLTYTEGDAVACGKTLFTGGVDLPED